MVIAVLIALIAWATGGRGSHGTSRAVASLHGGTEAAVGKLKRVSDGDTVVVRWRDLDLTVRLRNIDTPESVHRDESRNTDFGREVSAWAKDYLDDVTVRIEFQTKGDGAIATDQYGRALGDLWLDRGPPGPAGDELYAETVIRKGYSRYETGFGRSERYDERLQAAENEARAAHHGVWSARK